MKNSEYILGIDIGTGSTKAVAVNFSGDPLVVTQHHYISYSPYTGYNEQKPDDIWKAFKTCIRETITSLNVPAAISLSSAMHSLMAVDIKGNPLTNLITWADSRAEEITSKLCEEPGMRAIYEATGTPLHPMSPLFKLIWFKENAPDIFARAYKFISIKEYIWFKCFGEFEIDYSIASATGLFDIEQKKWHLPSLNLAGLKEEKLSKAVSTRFTRNTLTKEASSAFGVSPNLQFVIGASDGCLANLGSDAIKDGSAALTVGTSGAVRISSPTPLRNKNAMIFNYVLDDDCYICGGPINNGGNTIQWFIRNFVCKDDPKISKEDYDTFFKLVSEFPSTEGLLFLPYLHGERAPIWDVRSAGNFFGIKGDHRKQHFARAVLEGVCFALNDVIKMVEEVSLPIDQVHVSGGIIQSDLWLQILADITQKRLCVMESEDASAIGAAMLGLKAIGVIQSLKEIKGKEPFKRIEPNSDNKKYQQFFLIYRRLYSLLKEEMHQLHYLNLNH